MLDEDCRAPSAGGPDERARFVRFLCLPGRAHRLSGRADGYNDDRCRPQCTGGSEDAETAVLKRT